MGLDARKLRGKKSAFPARLLKRVKTDQIDAPNSFKRRIPLTQHSKMQHIRRKKQRTEKLLSNEIKREKKLANAATAKPAAKAPKAEKPAAKSAKAAKTS
jgi:hypothetical protein